MTISKRNKFRKQTAASLIYKSLLLVILVFFVPVGFMLAMHYSGGKTGWNSQRTSTEQAPEASSTQAVIQVYAARAARWRGAIGVHTWVAVKRSNDTRYTRIEVIGYRLRWGGDSVQIRNGVADAMWFGNRPTLLRDIRGGQAVDQLIDTIVAAAQSYPYNHEYKVWPGPNSNTFIAHLARHAPELQLELPPTAVGKDYLPGAALLAITPSGTGVQASLGGYFGLMLGFEEGFEMNVLGLSAGIDFKPLALKLPGVGRIGFVDSRRIDIDQSQP